ncbi:MAG: TonB-dependent receptor [Henriciella sp.]|jgi:iron complex outermembrane receptor protein|nr:TonB-dependent receptor [Hyphomonadaceae bacterium]
MYKSILMTGVCLALVPGFASAQESDGTEVQEARRLTAVTVTAQKRAQDVQDVPISISAYGEDFIEDSGVETLGDISLYSPNFTITSSSQKTNSRIAIRGVGSVGNAGIEPSVGVFIDGVYYPRPGSVIGNLIDLEAIEVLRGPQGTLFGRNTPMGALNVRTKNPSDDFEYYVEGGFGSYDAFDLGGVISGPLSDKVSGRLSAKYSERGGYGDNLLTNEEYGEQDDFNIRGKLLFDLSDNLEVKVSADYGEINSGGQAIEFLNGTESPVFLGTLQALAGPDAAQILTNDPFDHDIYQDHRDSLADEQWGVAVDASWELGSGHTLRSITSYRDWEAKYFESAIRLPIQLFPRKTDYNNETFSQEFQLLSPTGETFEYVLGAFFYDETYEISQDFDLGAQFCIPVVAGLAGLPAAQGCAAGQQIDASDGEFAQDLQSMAFFGQGTYHVNDQLSFTLGGRWTSDEKDADFSNVVNNPFVIALSVRDNENRPGLTVDDSKFTYFANASYFPVDDTMLFATVSTGYKSGGFNTDGTFPALTEEQRVFAEEDTTNYEVGIKTQLLDNTLQLNATLFRMDIEGFQDRAFDGISFITRNVGELRQQGVEADFVWAPLDQLTFNGGLSYLDSEFQDYRNASPLPGGPVQDLTGQRAHFAPEWQGSLVADWTDAFTPISGTEYFLRGETQYVGDQNIGGNTNQNPQSFQEGYQLFNARIGLRADDERWEVNLFGKNLGDEGYCLTIFDQPFGGQLGGVNPVANTIPQRCAVGAPQTWGVQLKLRN